MTGKLVFWSSPNNIGEVVDATVPKADANPIAIPLICAGNN